jgi:hypothetical protein
MSVAVRNWLEVNRPNWKTLAVGTAQQFAEKLPICIKERLHVVPSLEA